MQLIFDTESDGFVAELTKLHSLVLRDAETDAVVLSCAHKADYGTPKYAPIEEGLEMLSKADLIIGHNVCGHDVPAILKVYPDWRSKARVLDTLVLSRLSWPTDLLRDADFKLQKRGKMPGQMIGRHSIEAWGHRLGIEKKGVDIKDWSTWTPYMHERCESDCSVNVALYKHLKARADVPEDVLQIEQRVAEILARQERRGFLFDMGAALKLRAKLESKHAELEDGLRTLFPPWEKVTKEDFTPKANNKTKGWVKGVPTVKVKTKTIVFNPASRDHIADRLKTLRGWKPTEFTNSGKAKVDETTLGQLPYPEAKALAEYLTVEKRLGQLANGKEALIKHVKADGRIHGRVNANGTFTWRMTHSHPNISQVPSVKKVYGREFRECLVSAPGMILVGADADALEARCLAHYMAAYDNGAYVKVVLEGKKEDGTDLHSVNSRALGLDPKKVYPVDGSLEPGREIAKRFFYAFLYGGGGWKLGHILGHRGSEAKVAAAGSAAKVKFLRGLPALGKLIDAIKAANKQRGFLKAIDGRRLYVRSDHAALNTVLQSAGGILMKHALVHLDDALLAAVPGWADESEFVANVHDEIQTETKVEYAEIIGRQACASIVTTGEKLRFRCPLAGDYNIGPNWSATH